MILHIVKLCVGADSVEDLAEWQIGQIKRAKTERRKITAPVCGTRMWPKRADEVLAGGSLYWVIKGVVVVRQRIIAIDDVTDDHGQRCGLYLDAHLQRTVPQPRRAFQGWRYLDPKDAPADLSEAHGGADLPEHLRRQLVELGAW
ncbi:MAG: DUF1489 domain-containing protein [Hyphomonadaceae bacterium JAD_PAG50586_4]|nr:MAG: DUF1489 domain-containing protein [Hyphomonadaceae bacterium JAD_PAG50586_4]